MKFEIADITNPGKKHKLLPTSATTQQLNRLRPYSSTKQKKGGGISPSQN